MDMREHGCDRDAEKKTADMRPEGDTADRRSLRSREYPGTELGDEPKE
jgi:hypothetical protein